MANDRLKNIGDEICGKHLGFEPTSSSTKPPAIANSLFRRVKGQTWNSRNVHEWIISERRLDKSKLTTSEAIIEKYSSILKLGEKESVENIRSIRYLLEKLFNPDKAAFPDYGFSLYNISSHWLIKGPVKSEANIGKFIYDILQKKIDGKASPALELLKDALKNDKDDYTKTIKPIIAFSSENKEDEASIASHDKYSSYDDIELDPCKLSIRKGFDMLAINMLECEEAKRSLLVMERMVHFAGFAALFYLMNASTIKANRALIPLLLDSGINTTAVKKASEECLIIGKKSVEEYFTQCIEDIISHEVLNEISKCEKYIKDLQLPQKLIDSGVRGLLLMYLDSFFNEGSSPIKALARSLQIGLFSYEYKYTSPSDFCRILGVSCGILGPRGNAAKRKRFLINTAILEVLTLSVLSIEELSDGIELKELGERLRERYQIIIGSDADKDYSLLSEFNVAQNIPGDLRGDLAINSKAIADLYISIGLAKQYADGVTIIGRRL